MKKYTLKNFIEDAKTKNLYEEKQQGNNKMFYIFDTQSKTKILKINQQNEFLTMLNYLANTMTKKYLNTNQKYISLENFTNSQWEYIYYEKYEDIFITCLSKKKEESLKNAIKKVLEFNKKNSKNYYYMIEWGNGYNELKAAIYNYMAFYHRELNSTQKTSEVNNFFKLLNEIDPYIYKNVLRDLKQEKERIKKQDSFINSFLTIFNNCLDFNISLDLNHEKVGGLKEQQALKIVEKIGGYNEFNINEFKKLLNYCNNNFIKYYRAGNCNNYSKDYNINFGRESSIVFYLTFTTHTEKEAEEHKNALKELLKADEVDITHCEKAYLNTYSTTIRFWYD